MRGRVLASALVAVAAFAAPGGPAMSVVLIDLDADGLVLTGEHHAVTTDADGDGAPERLAWTAFEQRDGFLWLDADGDGSLDAGELLAEKVAESASEGAVGRLAALDRRDGGGDGDGWLTPADAAWPRLGLWVDVDHDGRAAPGELSALGEEGAQALSLDWRALDHIDGSLNRHRRSSVLRLAGPRPGEERQVPAVEVLLRLERH